MPRAKLRSSVPPDLADSGDCFNEFPVEGATELLWLRWRGGGHGPPPLCAISCWASRCAWRAFLLLPVLALFGLLQLVPKNVHEDLRLLVTEAESRKRI